MAEDRLYDVFVIGGGINGCGIARDAIGRGYSVCLAEMNDLASGTSSWSSKLIHGGFRYLEYYEFRLVRESLTEREVLLANAAHIIWPMRFVLPHHKDMRPAWLLRLGLFLYDHIGKRKLLPGTKTVDLTSSPVGKPLKPLFSKGFEYSDCWVNDARLVVLNALDAAERGADIRTRTQVVKAERRDGVWEITMLDRSGPARTAGREQTVRARLIVNAGGPWVDRVLSGAIGRNDAHNVRLVQGSHIVVPKLHDHDRAYIFQNGDGRIIFALPYEEDFTLIGTTDQDYEGDPKDVAITDTEIDYLCAAASEYFAKPVERGEIVWTYSGVRPLYDDGASAAQEATREYVIKPDPGEGAPLLNIFGGKITTYRKLSESMLELIEARLGKKSAPWTHRAALPGGDFPADGFDAEVARLQAQYPFLAPHQARRYVRHYGTRSRILLGNARSLADLGQDFGHDLFGREVDYLMAQEWAVEAADVIWRRTKRGLRLSQDQVTALETYMEQRAA
ncbi:MAG: glycerol-3-phosphate dehydrogenase [Hoeflea sp.]|uniref:glycerol-3-phosphate dehydrogenase n=1 Tax=Hoeflea sp. TaxID=1940281 RepID=UPI001D5192A1|nr:glycerol-3-phosphate dehydrogenase [Hoeflea sp.]MBU4528314.1 glycerol-3-phosphate dehydrogenase [Alphaproteobacteria bacterium]MBU4542983.1 glycerol-3-phosphate dehydrogenase [Alphaproteobacteria bacterium]MBU4551674.1 glycerol-3-phosphate dehydrogenase [Alphaproteobacteria bacterium]MBV1723569.1 glycerol-3-phosphate dehydrogenase [Hoeflea sp.]MBV1761885.1 glycerol-3-phosphate dehydrogenase [Hoeflea sp.]